MRINANNSYKLVKEEVNNTYEVLKDGLSMEGNYRHITS